MDRWPEGWDEAYEAEGWGEDANGDLLNAVTEGMLALLAYADGDVGGTATLADVLELLGEAERYALDDPVSYDAGEAVRAAVARLRAQLATVPAALAAA